MKIFAAP